MGQAPGREPLRGSSQADPVGLHEVGPADVWRERRRRRNEVRALIAAALAAFLTIAVLIGDAVIDHIDAERSTAAQERSNRIAAAQLKLRNRREARLVAERQRKERAALIRLRPQYQTATRRLYRLPRQRDRVLRDARFALSLACTCGPQDRWWRYYRRLDAKAERLTRQIKDARRDFKFVKGRAIGAGVWGRLLDRRRPSVN